MQVIFQFLFYRIEGRDIKEEEVILKGGDFELEQDNFSPEIR